MISWTVSPSLHPWLGKRKPGPCTEQSMPFTIGKPGPRVSGHKAIPAAYGESTVLVCASVATDHVRVRRLTLLTGLLDGPLPKGIPMGEGKRSIGNNGKYLADRDDIAADLNPMGIPLGENDAVVSACWK